MVLKTFKKIWKHINNLLIAIFLIVILSVLNKHEHELYTISHLFITMLAIIYIVIFVIKVIEELFSSS